MGYNIMIINEFFNEKVPGKVVGISVADAVEIACGGGRVFMSKRLRPPLTLCNGRIYADDDFVFSSDIEIMACKRSLLRVAGLYGVKISLLAEHGDDVYWSSDKPEEYNGEPIDAAYESDKRHMETVRRQWMIDHGLARRTFREWLRIKRAYWNMRYKCFLYERQNKSTKQKDLTL